MSLLSQIHTPADLRTLSIEQLETLAKEMRERIFSAVSLNGGHLASNLGVVELSVGTIPSVTAATRSAAVPIGPIGGIGPPESGGPALSRRRRVA